MADTELYCECCAITNPHTLVGDNRNPRLCICVVCGSKAQVPYKDLKSVQEAIIKRKQAAANLEIAGKIKSDSLFADEMDDTE